MYRRSRGCFPHKKGFTELGASTTLWRDADGRIQAVVAAGPAYNHYFDIAGQRTGKVRSSWATAADAVEYYHPDHVGSNTLVTNAAGEVVQETVTTPFGELHALVDGAGNAVSPSDSTTRYLFTDQEHDAESGLHYFGARFRTPIRETLRGPGTAQFPRRN